MLVCDFVMARNIIISVLLFCFFSCGLRAAETTEESIEAFELWRARQKLMPDGFALSGIDGTLYKADSNQAGQEWFFKFDSQLKANTGLIEAGESVELLPSSTLEAIITDVNSRVNRGYRLWGMFTRYRDKNYIFCNYFLGLSKIKPLEPEQTEQAKPSENLTPINAPNDVVSLPPEVLKKLKKRRVIRTEELQKPLELKADSVLADRTGFLKKDAGGKKVFVLDGLGWNVPKVSFRLLPCYVLERAENKQTEELELLRFKVAGVVTKFQGEHYLLLQRARRVYSHENFGR